MKKAKSKQMKLPKGVKTIPVDWLGLDVLVVRNDKQRVKLANMIGLSNEDGFLCNGGGINGMASVLYSNQCPVFVLFIPEKDRRVIIHECTHMVHMVFDVHGIPLSGDNTETIAYMTDYLCERVFDLFGVTGHA